MSVAFDDHGIGAAVTASAQLAGLTRPDEIEQVVRDSVLRLRSIQSVGAAVSRLPALPAGFTRAIQATENAWRRIDEEFGLLTSTEVAQRIGSKSPHRTLASELRRRGQLIGVSRLNSFRYPGFQFTADSRVHPAVPPLLEAASDSGWSESDLALWLCNPSGSFGGARPVDHLDDADVVDIARAVMATDW